jgi:hypothetical protein
LPLVLIEPESRRATASCLLLLLLRLSLELRLLLRCCVAVQVRRCGAEHAAARCEVSARKRRAWQGW